LGGLDEPGELPDCRNCVILNAEFAGNQVKLIGKLIAITLHCERRFNNARQRKSRQRKQGTEEETQADSKGEEETKTRKEQTHPYLIQII
jgi:hypothetical protein